MSDNINFDYKNLSPFKWFVLENFPFIEADFDALTEWQLFCKIGKEINKIINSENTLGTQMENVTNAFIDLQNYVNNYFDNLDVQEEVNTKLNEMVQDGTFEQIIAKYITTSYTNSYNTLSDLIEDETLIVGNRCITYGYHTINDGGDGIYYITETGTADNGTCILLSNGLYANLIFNKKEIKAKQFGCIADGKTDDTDRLQNAINVCKINGYELILEGYSYVTLPINTKGIRIKGLGIPANMGPTYTSKKYGYLGWQYLRNENQGALITFDDVVDDYLTTGSGICSQNANPIIYCNHSDGKFNLENLTICGWLRNTNQEGVLSKYESDDNNYINGVHKFKNVYIINCGNNGLHLQSLETTVIENLQCNFNFGYGCYIEGVDGFDTPFEYVDLYNCHFNGNKLGGFYAHNTYRKQVRFIRCQANSSGLYAQLGITLPATTQELIAGFKIDGKETSSNTARQGLVFDNCYGEETNKFIELLLNGNNNNYIANNITITNNISYPTTNNDICCLLFLDSYYTTNYNMFNNYFNGNNLFIPSSNNLNVLPLVVDNTYNIKNYRDVTVNSKINVDYKIIHRDGNLITMKIKGTVNDTINAYENILSNFTVPTETINFPIFINNEPYIAGFYTNTQCTVNKQMQTGDHILIDLTYNVSNTKFR